MKLAVRASKIDAVKLQLLLSLELKEVNIVAAPTNYGGITILNLDESAFSALSSIRNIEALYLMKKPLLNYNNHQWRATLFHSNH